MKKKIVYISGADVFDIKDVRAAFDEVRNTLGLDSDTILFGVPIDEVIESAEPKPRESVEDKIVNIAPRIDIESEKYEFCTEDIQSDKEDIGEPIESEMSVANSNIAVEDVPVVPIQSILSAETKKTKSKKKTTEKMVAKEDVDVIPAATESVIATEEDSAESDAEAPIAEDAVSIQEVKIEDMITDEMPAEPTEKTLEELLESMTPLREDVRADTDSAPVADQNEEIDATLENLASEFADTQAKIPTNKKSAGRGKIGKLKGIIPLPFSKKNKDDSGIMGDLFGWAGFAANDDDFTIPGFFTNAAGKK